MEPSGWASMEGRGEGAELTSVKDATIGFGVGERTITGCERRAVSTVISVLASIILALGRGDRGRRTLGEED